MNCCNFTGRLTRDPELKRTMSNKAYVDFYLAVPRRDKAKTTDFIPCIAWNATAETMANYLSKGSQIEVTGKFEDQPYEKNGEKRHKYQIVVSSIGFLGSSDKPAEEKNTEPVKAPPVEDTGYYQPSLDEDDESMLPFDI